jgi:hypothetical protein
MISQEVLGWAFWTYVWFLLVLYGVDWMKLFLRAFHEVKGTEFLFSGVRRDILRVNKHSVEAYPPRNIFNSSDEATLVRRIVIGKLSLFSSFSLNRGFQGKPSAVFNGLRVTLNVLSTSILLVGNKMV